MDETPAPTSTLTQAPTRLVTPVPEITLTPTTQAQFQVEPDDLAGSLVKFAHPWVGEPAKTLERIAMEFSLTNPYDIWVEVHAHGGEWALIDALQADLDTGEPPNLIAVRPYQLSALTEDYSLADLRDYYDDPMWGFDAQAQADILPVFLEPFIRGDQIMALPVAPQATALFYNQTWGEELGFSTPPADIDAFKRQACEATFANWQDESKQDGTGGWMINLDPMVLTNWYYAFGGRLPASDLPSFNNEAGQEAFGYLWDIKNEGCIWFARQPDPYDYFANRFTLLYAGTLEQIPIQMSWMTVADSEDEWAVIGFPGPAGETILVDGPGLMISTDTPENQLAAWLFAKHLLEPEVQAKLVQSLFTLPVRGSAMALLSEFEDDYPHWGQGAALVESASALPVSDGWGVAQWVLQDAVNRILQAETGEVTILLEQLDAMIVDLVGASP